LASGPRGFGNVALCELAAAVLVASAVAGVAGYCGANEVPPRPVFRRPIFMSRRDLAALVCWSRRSSSYIGQTALRSCSRPATSFGGARRPAPWPLPAHVFMVVLIKWPGGA
jgi:hypothetical protein